MTHRRRCGCGCCGRVVVIVVVVGNRMVVGSYEHRNNVVSSVTISRLVHICHTPMKYKSTPHHATATTTSTATARSCIDIVVVEFVIGDGGAEFFVGLWGVG